MAKKKAKKINVNEKLNYKKPLKNCAPALDDIRRIRNNEQAKLRRLQKKFEALPIGKRGTKKQADVLRKEIKGLTLGIDALKRSVKDVQGACQVIDGNKAQIKSLKLKAAAIDRKIKKLPKSEIGSPAYKKLQNEALKLMKGVKEYQRKNADVLYGVNKNLGFEPEVIADRLDMRRQDLEELHKEDFREGYFDEEFEEIPEATGGPGVGADILDDLLETEEELEADEKGYIDIYDDIFWQVSQDFSKNERSGLAQYDSVIIQFDGHTHRYSGSSLSLITSKFDEAVRWANSEPPYVRVTKYISEDQTKLKYVFYKD